MTPRITKPAVFNDVAGLIPQGAILLWRPTTWVGWLFARYDRSPYCHVGTFYQGSGTAWSLEFLQFCGGVQKSLAEYVAQYPGKIDVFDYAGWTTSQRIVIYEEMQRLIATYPRYGWKNLWRASRWYLPGIRLFGTLDTDDAREYTGAPHCSMARALTERTAGFDSVYGTPPHMTTPGDYGRRHKKLFTLFETEDQIRETLEDSKWESDKRQAVGGDLQKALCASWQDCFC